MKYLAALAAVASLATAGAGATSSERVATVAIENGLIVFGSNRTTPRNEEIYVMNADGTGERRLADSSGHDSEAVWSPDGRRIAFFGRRNRNTDIYVMNANGQAFAV